MRRDTRIDNLALQRRDGLLESVPQVPDLSALFESLPTARALVKPKDGVLICRVELNSPYASDLGSAPEPGAILRFAGHLLFFAGGNDRYTDYFSVPKLDVPVGEDLEVELLDFDLMRHDYLGQFGTPFDGFLPIAIQHPKFGHRLDCRLLGAAVISTRIKPLLKRAELSLKGLRKFKPSIPMKDLGYARTRHESAWKALDAVAAYTGWDHPALGELAKQVERRDEAWFKDAEVLIEGQLSKMQSGLEARLKTPSTEAWKPFVDCVSGTTKTACTLRVFVQHRASKPLEMKLIDAQGMEQTPHIIESLEGGDSSVPAGFRRKLLKISMPEDRPFAKYEGPAGVNPGSRIRILQVCNERPKCWLRLDQ